MTDAAPATAVPLEYDRRSPDPWRPVVRLTALAVVAQGLTMALPGVLGATELLARSAAIRSIAGNPADGAWLVVELARGGVGVALAVGGGMVVRGRPTGRPFVVAGEVAAAVLVVAQMLVTVWRTYALLSRASAGGGADWLRLIGMQLLYAPQALVLPALVWALFRRPEVREALAS